MPKSNIKETLNELSKTDIYSLVLFALWQMSEIKEYSTLSELAYILDNKNLIKFLSYYGGKTITIPTKEEFEDVVDTLLLYSLVNLENVEFSEAMKQVNPTSGANKIKDIYTKLSDILAKYDFRRD